MGVIENVVYSDRIIQAPSEQEIDNILKLQPAGSSHPRVLIFLDDARSRNVPAYLAASKLQNQSHFVQLTSEKWVIGKFKLQRVPSFTIVDPATRQPVQSRPQQLPTDGISKVLNAVSSSNFLPELNQQSFEERCKG